MNITDKRDAGEYHKGIQVNITDKGIQVNFTDQRDSGEYHKGLQVNITKGYK